MHAYKHVKYCIITTSLITIIVVVVADVVFVFVIVVISFTRQTNIASDTKSQS